MKETLNKTTPYELSEEAIEEAKKELAVFAAEANEIIEQEKSIRAELESKGINIRFGTPPKYLYEVAERKQEYMRKLEQTSAYKRISAWVSERAHRCFVEESIRLDEYSLRDYGWKDKETSRDTKKKLDLARKYLDENNISDAVDLFFQLGSCHYIWTFEQRIFEETFGVIYFPPPELNLEIIYD